MIFNLKIEIDEVAWARRYLERHDARSVSTDDLIGTLSDRVQEWALGVEYMLALQSIH